MGLLDTIEFEHKKITDPSDLKPFSCDDEEINSFYKQDIIPHAKSLISVSYLFETGGKVLGFYCVSNDRVDAKFSKIKYIVPYGKLYGGAPAVKIGRLGVSSEFERQGVGSDILNFIKYSFSNNNKTGCRFIVVDAANMRKVINFYEKNDFKFLTNEDKKSDTRIMYFDLIRYR